VWVQIPPSAPGISRPPGIAHGGYIIKYCPYAARREGGIGVQAEVVI